MDPLYKLPNGEWINLNEVQAITPNTGGKEEFSGTFRSPWVTIATSRGGHGVILDPHDDPYAWADEFAEVVNASRKEE